MTTLADACTELATLIPCLAQALPRDNTTSGRGGDPSASVPFNPDVMHALTVIAAEIPRATRLACVAIGEPWQPRTIPTCLRALPRLAGRLTSTGQQAAAAQLDEAARWWIRITKQALGLRTPDLPIGYPCPIHDGPPAGLLAAGSEGFLRRQRDGLVVEWVHAGRVFCPACGAAWGPGEWAMLGRVLQETA